MEDLVSEYTPSSFPGFDIALDVVICIAVIVGFLVIFQSMYTAVLERTREIGILKSLGSSKATIVSVVLRETALMAVAGVLLGIAGTYGVRDHPPCHVPTFALRNDRLVDRLRHLDRVWQELFSGLCIRHGWRRARIRSTRWRTNNFRRTGRPLGASTPGNCIPRNGRSFYLQRYTLVNPPQL